MDDGAKLKAKAFFAERNKTRSPFDTNFIAWVPYNVFVYQDNIRPF